MYVSDILNVIYSKVLCMQKQKFVFKREQLHECCEGERIWSNECMCVGVATPRYIPLSTLHEIKGFVDISERHGVCDKLIHLQLSCQILLHQLRHTVTTLPAWRRKGRGGEGREGREV